MNQHLTDEQIAYYSAARSNDEESIKIGRHLLNCEECCKRMPPPTAERFLEAVFGVGEEDSEFSSEDIEQMAVDWRRRLREEKDGEG